MNASHSAVASAEALSKYLGWEVYLHGSAPALPSAGWERGPYVALG
jgi:hypothetical protein